MYVILVDYIAPLSEIDDALEAHGQWLDEQYRAGRFLASGRQEPRTGGVILAVGDKTDLENAIALDPFGRRGLARHTIVEFHPSKLGGPLDTDHAREALR